MQLAAYNRDFGAVSLGQYKIPYQDDIVIVTRAFNPPNAFTSASILPALASAKSFALDFLKKTPAAGPRAPSLQRDMAAAIRQIDYLSSIFEKAKGSKFVFDYRHKTFQDVKAAILQVYKVASQWVEVGEVISLARRQLGRDLARGVLPLRLLIKPKSEPKPYKPTVAKKPPVLPGAISPAMAAAQLQNALRNLGSLTRDPILSSVVADGKIGPGTTRAVNQAFTRHIGPGSAVAPLRTGRLTVKDVNVNTRQITAALNAEIARRREVMMRPAPGPAPSPMPAEMPPPEYLPPAPAPAPAKRKLAPTPRPSDRRFAPTPKPPGYDEVPPAPPPELPPGAEKPGLSTGAKIGIAAGGVVVLGVLGYMIFGGGEGGGGQYERQQPG
jgi:peptidoglycan hydrolase-like protein with peptidoglycan-binding domain